MVDENNARSLISTTDLANSIRHFLEMHTRRPATPSDIFNVLQAALADYFDKGEAQQYLDKTIQNLRTYRILDSHITEYAIKLNSDLHYLIIATRLNENKDYLDYLYYELVTIHHLKLLYAKSKTFSSSSL